MIKLTINYKTYTVIKWLKLIWIKIVVNWKMLTCSSELKCDFLLKPTKKTFLIHKISSFMANSIFQHVENYELFQKMLVY